MMVEVLRDYSLPLIDGVPHEVYIMAWILFCTGSIVSLGLNGWQKGIRYSMALLLLEYVFLLYGSTVFFRETKAGRQYDFTPFWSYSVERLIPENIMNVVVFVPIGVLLGFMVNGSRLTVRKGWLVAFCVGMGLSVGIEALQFVLKRGFSEVDDVMHNTLGCLIGYGLYSIIKKGYERITEGHEGVLCKAKATDPSAHDLQARISGKAERCSYLFWPRRRPEKQRKTEGRVPVS